MPHTSNSAQVLPATVDELNQQLEAANKQRRKLLLGVVMRSGDDTLKLVEILIDKATPETLREVEAFFEV